jgi:putative aminopeptidase FrvX
MKLLEQLTLTPGISGREHRVRELITSQVKGMFDSIRTDELGSLIGLRKPRPRADSKTSGTPLKVMVAVHMDQIGFMVRHVDDKGFLRVNAVGGFDTRNLFARLVTVCTAKGDIPGVLNPSGRPTHIASEEDRRKIPQISDLVIDTGLPAKTVRGTVRIGDMVVIQAAFTKVGKTVVAQALDNRVACWIAIRALQKLRHHACEIHCAFTVQEEVGLRGAGTAAFGIRPDVGIAIDTTLCVDIPGVPEDERVTQQGAGAALTVMDAGSIADLDLFETFEAAAKKAKIKTQRSILPRGATDAGTMQRAATGARTMTLSCPTRYIHTITEMIHMDDLHACRDVLAAYLASV